MIHYFPESWASQTIIISSLILTTVFVSVYIVTGLLFESQRRSQGPVKVPPTVPYMIPFIGSAISFALNPGKCITASRQQSGPEAVHGLRILNQTLYFLYKPGNIAKIWKYRTTITTPGVTAFVLKTLFGMSPKAVSMYTLDTSGIYTKPREDAKVAPHNRVDHLTHVNFHKHLLGEGLQKTYENFAGALIRRLPSLSIQDEWKEFPDIMEFWMHPLTASMNEALAGTTLECLNPNFTRDLLRYFPCIQGMMKGLPRWYIPEAYRLRESLVRDVKQWHAIARTRFKETDIDNDGGTDPWWGSAFMRERQKFLSKVDNWDCDAIASSDFGILWGSSVNVHPMAIWNVIEIFRDKCLLSRVRAELAAAEFCGITSSQDIDKLLSLPLLQSIYAELLRLRIEVQTVFSSDREDIRINQWRFPRNSLVIVPAGAAHMDPEFWNTKNGEYPVDRFWADRFLLYLEDPRSGPRSDHVTDEGTSDETARVSSNPAKAKFVSSGLANSFMPWGIGERTCPGRAVARREILAFCATVVDQFDIEILSTDEPFEMDPAFYGIGTQRPLRSIPFKVRKRKVEAKNS